MTNFMDNYFRYLKAGKKEYTEAEVLTIIDGAIAAEREACAKVCDEKVEAEYATGKVDHNEMGWTQSCAIAIRARGQHGH